MNMYMHVCVLYVCAKHITEKKELCCRGFTKSVFREIINQAGLESFPFKMLI